MHFACTSEDINNLSYALMLGEARQEVLLPRLDALIQVLRGMAHAHAALPMLSRTHGQTASPTTVGKELANVVARLQRQGEVLAGLPMPGKINGAVGNYNAHVVAYPDIDWPSFSRRFVESLGLDWQPYTTQIEPHDGIAELCDVQAHLTITIKSAGRWANLAGLLQASRQEGNGSSTMPHKVTQSIENAEGNFGIATRCSRTSRQLRIRGTRDLTDSTCCARSATPRHSDRLEHAARGGQLLHQEHGAT